MKKEVQDKKVFQIPEVNLASFKSKIGRLQKRAVKLGCGEISWTIIKEYHKPDPRKDDTFTTPNLDAAPLIKYFEIEIDGDQPKLAGWLFAARLEHDERIGTIIRVIPGAHIPKEYYDADLYNCDHCKKKIFRRDTFIVNHKDTNEWKQVGRVCLRDFLGHDNPENVAKYCECLFSAVGAAEDAEFLNGFGQGREAKYYYELEPFLALTSAMIRDFGWLSRTKAKDENYAVSTADKVEAYIFGKAKNRDDVKVLDADKREAKKVIKWATGLNVYQNWEDEYKWNIKLIAEAGVVDCWKAGFAASMVMGYRRELAKEAAKKKQKWAGKIGEKTEFKNAKCVFTTSFETQYGTSHLYKFVYNEHAILVWFASKPQEINQGSVCDVVGTVKKHEEYQGQKQTIMTRCKITNIKEETK